MRILIISALYHPEPVVSAKISRDIKEELNYRGHLTTVICPTPSRPDGFNFGNFLDDDDVIRLNSFIYPKSKYFGRFIESISFSYRAILFLIKNKDFDFVYVNSWPIIPPFIIGLFVRIYKIKSILHVMDLYPEALKINRKNILYKFLLFFDKITLGLYNEVVYLAEDHINYIARTRKINTKKIHHINLWAEDPMHKNKKKINSTINLLYFGNVGPLSNLDELIGFFKKNDLNIFLTIAGSGSEKERLVDFVNKEKIKNVKFKDVPLGQESQLIEGYDLMILPQKPGTANNSIPSKVLMYFFMRKPVLAFVDKGSMIDSIIKNNLCGYSFSWYEKEKINTFFQNLHNLNPGDLEIMGINGYNFSKKNFSKEINLNKLVRLFEV